NTYVMGYWSGASYYNWLYSDGITLDMNNRFLDPDISIQFFEGVILTGIMPRIELSFSPGSIPNEFDCSFGLYEAPLGSIVYTLIPQTKIDYGKIIIPPNVDRVLNRSLTNLNLRTDSNKHYLFAFYHGFKTAQPTFDSTFVVNGEYSYRLT
ncbi:MAG: hypothetical protein ACRDBM_03575, partial [Sporomusa sp.]